MKSITGNGLQPRASSGPSCRGKGARFRRPKTRGCWTLRARTSTPLREGGPQALASVGSVQSDGPLICRCLRPKRSPLSSAIPIPDPKLKRIRITDFEADFRSRSRKSRSVLKPKAQASGDPTSPLTPIPTRHPAQTPTRPAPLRSRSLFERGSARPSHTSQRPTLFPRR